VKVSMTKQEFIDLFHKRANVYTRAFRELASELSGMGALDDEMWVPRGTHISAFINELGINNSRNEKHYLFSVTLLAQITERLTTKLSELKTEYQEGLKFYNKGEPSGDN